MIKYPRGYRNNNPGNIEKGQPWQGLSPVQADDRFCTFSHPAWGIRAIAVILLTYYDRRRSANGTRVDTIREVIERWAPAFENNVQAYINHVDEKHPKGADSPLDFHKYEDIEPLVQGIIEHELGRPQLYGLSRWYSQAVVDAGLKMAGIIPPWRSIVEGV